MNKVEAIALYQSGLEPTVAKLLELAATKEQLERQQRPAVVARKNSGGNHSDCGAQTQAVLRAIFFTLGLRGQEPVTRVTQMVEEYLENGRVATFKAWFSSNG